MVGKPAPSSHEPPRQWNQAPVTLIYQWKNKKGAGRGKWPVLSTWRWCKQGWLHWPLTRTTDRQHAMALLVVNCVKLHLTSWKVSGTQYSWVTLVTKLESNLKAREKQRRFRKGRKWQNGKQDRVPQKVILCCDAIVYDLQSRVALWDLLGRLILTQCSAQPRNSQLRRDDVLKTSLTHSRSQGFVTRSSVQSRTLERS